MSLNTIKINTNQVAEFPEISYLDNPEFAFIKMDNEDRILYGVKQDGEFFFGAGCPHQVRDYVEQKLAELSLDEYEDIVAFLSDLEKGDETLQNLLDKKVDGEYVENPEYIEVKTDSEGKLLAGRTSDGAAFENVGFSTPKLSIDGHIIENIKDIEGRSEITTDSEGKIISYRDSDGVKHEEAGLHTNKITLSDEGLDDLGKALKGGGYGNVFDWSDKEEVELPIPQGCAIVNFGVDSQATSKSDKGDYNPSINADIPTTLEYWDINGNYFKKPILLSAQGSSSMGYWIKNQAVDIDDGSTIKFGNWVAQDSFHIKKYYIDVFRGQCVAAYWLTEQMYQTRAYGERRPWNYLIQAGTTQNAIGKFNKDFDTGALGHPDGFPVHVFFNGKDAGIYAFNLKKHRDNYYQKKDNINNIILDGKINSDFLFGGTIDWTKFEIRNPKTKKKKDGWELVDVNGDTYNGDFPTELMGTATPGYDSSNLSHVKSADTKAVIERLSTVNAALAASKTKETFETYFDVPFFIDYYLISQVLYNFDGFNKNWIWCTWDGELWTPTSYDMDSIFGMYWNGTRVFPSGEYMPISNTPAYDYNTNSILGNGVFIVKTLRELYLPEIKARYKELRDKGIFSTENIVSLLEKWVSKCGYDNLKNDIENVCSIDGVPQTPSYRDGNVTYVTNPTEGGFYNSLLRIKRWLDEHIAYLDSDCIFSYQ